MKGFLGSNSSAGSSSKGATVDTLIGRQTEVLGDVRFAGGLHVDGKIKGSVTTLGADKSATLSVSETGAIDARETHGRATRDGVVSVVAGALADG